MHTQTTVRSRYKGPVPVPNVHSHGLNVAGYSTDEALAEILDKYPRHLIDINRYTFDADGQHTLSTGSLGDLSGVELLAAIQAGEIWVNMREVEIGWPRLWQVAMDSFDDISRNYKTLNAVTRSGQLILSSPKTRVPYHFDAAGVMLFHIRGSKRVYVYPGDEAHLPEEAMEKVVSRQTTEEIPYHRAYDRNAAVFDLMPGEALVWPLYSPHRVENLDAFCVSLSVDYQTWNSRMRNGALYTNAVMRSRGIRTSLTEHLGPLGLAWRWALSLGLRRLGVIENRIDNIEREFVPDARADGGIRTL